MPMSSRNFDYTAAFQEICDGMWGVWVGEHGFLVAIFGFKKDAEEWAAENYTEYGVDEIKLDK